MAITTATLVDIGSNTIRTSVYRIAKRKSGFKRIIDMSKAVGLSGYVDETGTMSSAGIEAGCRALEKMIRVSELTDSNKTFIFATGAVRNCVNSDDVVKALSKAAGYAVRVLTGQEEALLSASGALLETDIKTGLFFDLGGGSTELASVSKGAVIETDSVPIGALSSWKKASGDILLGRAEAEAIKFDFAVSASGSPVPLRDQPAVVGTGGSMRLALKLANTFQSERTSRSLSSAALDTILDMGARNSPDLYRLVLKLKPERIHTLLPACAIARSILALSNCDELVVSKAGLREGFLLSELGASFS